MFTCIFSRFKSQFPQHRRRSGPPTGPPGCWPGHRSGAQRSQPGRRHRLWQLLLLRSVVQWTQRWIWMSFFSTDISDIVNFFLSCQWENLKFRAKVFRAVQRYYSKLLWSLCIVRHIVERLLFQGHLQSTASTTSSAPTTSCLRDIYYNIIPTTERAIH